MKLNKFIYTIVCGSMMISSCADKMEYHEYVNYDADFIKKTFGDVGGLISDIYLGMDTDFGNY
ncbi:MAG: RagB/SusD family nutrient uptake outer membrane protein, partial [Bacteroides sp.]|nr:RagB/SusD family nutrient uptake outer membrane protein [Bacteroides sp.]